MSEVKVNKISPRSGTDVTLGDSGDTFTIPAGATLANNGTATGFFEGISWQSTIVTGTTLSAVAGNGYWIDTTSNACTITLPASPSVGDQIIFTDFKRTWQSNAVTLNLNSEKFQGNTTPVPVYNTTGESVDIVYSGATQGWIPNNDGAVALETPQSYSADFLVVAGGAAGASGNTGGGGGAGGFRTSTQTLIGGTVYTITVGDGGAAVTGSGPSAIVGTSGSNSSISGSGLTTITSAGGGGGGIFGSPGGAGGSGGGAGPTDSPSTFGSGNTPSTSPSQGNNGGAGYDGISLVTVAGGGGGAGAVGGDSGQTSGAGAFGGPGGNGLASSITGSSVTYAGGGGGNTERSDASSGAGGTGGGGAAADRATSAPAVAGTANLGGGGGGGNNNIDSGLSGAGGKGVVILSVPDANYSGTTTGSPTVATGVSGKTILTFTGSGSYTA
jgi:hypothetical protein